MTQQDGALRRAVFLDRDGVLNQARVIDGKSFPPATLADFVLLEGVEQACRQLKAAGLLLIVVTNQPDVATGVQQRSVVDAMHAKLCSALPLDAVLTCFHTDAEGCDCRKPRPGMLQEAARRFGIDLGSSFLVGDRWRDIEAGQAVACDCFFIDYGYAERAPAAPFRSVNSLLQASGQILESLSA